MSRRRFAHQVAAGTVTGSSFVSLAAIDSKNVSGGDEVRGATDPIEENKAQVRVLMEEVWNRWNLEAARKMIAPDFWDHLADPDQGKGFEGFEDNFVAWRKSFPDWKITIHEMVAQGDWVSARLTGGGTQTGEFNGIAPTNRKITLSAIEMFRFEDGKIKEYWANFDELGMYRQLGMIPLV